MTLSNSFRFLFRIFIVVAFIIIIPMLCGYVWYHFIVAEPISSAIMGIFCGAVADFLLWALIS